MKKTLKIIIKALSGLIIKLDIIALWRYVNRKKVRILLYHGVTKHNYANGENYEGKHVYFEKFENQIKYLKKKYNIISLKDFICRKKLPDNSVVITFDDGYENNFLNLYPIVEKYKIPVTIFIIPGVMNFVNKITWLGMLEYTIFYASKKRFDINFGSGELKTYKLETNKVKINACMEVKAKLKKMDYTAAKIIVDKAADQLKPDFKNCNEDYRLMNWDQVGKMNKKGVDFQSHTVNHPILTVINADDVLKQVSDSKKIIEKELNNEVYSFCYPDGYYNEEIIKILEENGYKCAVTTKCGCADKSYMYELKRIPVSNKDSFSYFVYRLLKS